MELIQDLPVWCHEEKKGVLMMTSTALQCGNRKAPFVDMVQNATEREVHTEGVATANMRLLLSA